MALNNDAHRSSDRDTPHPTPRKNLSRIVRSGSPAGRGSAFRRSSGPSRSAVAGSTATPVAPRRSRTRNALSVVVMTLAVGLVATVALPSYAFDPVANASPEFARSEVAAMTFDQPQQVAVAESVADTSVGRDAITATTPEELQAARDAAAAAAAAEQSRATASASYASYSGMSAREYLANPAYPNFSLSQVYQVGLQYQGVPYVYGGADPSGFDCSGFVMYVYAQFGIPLAHSVRSQAASGTVIDASAAQPGDLVIFSDGSHDGIYAGNGNILHAPYEGASVRVQPIWTDAHYFVRLGI